MSLLTGSVIHRYSWSLLPAPDDALTRVKQIAIDQNQPQVARNFKYSTDIGLLPDVPAAIEDGHNQLALEEHPIDANADGHNELIEWQNDDHQQEHQVLTFVP